MAWLLVPLLVVSWLATVLLMQRLVRCRRYQHESPPAFGTPYLNLSDTFNRNNYTAEGARLIPWVVVSLVVLAASFLASLWLLV